MNQHHICDYCRPETAWAHPLNIQAICGALEKPYPRPPIEMTVLSILSSAVTVAWSFWFMWRAGSAGVEKRLGFGLAGSCALAGLSLFVTLDAWWQWRKKTDGRYLYHQLAITLANGYRKCFEAQNEEINVRAESPNRNLS